MAKSKDKFDEAMDDIRRKKRMECAAPKMLEALKKAYTCMSLPDYIRSLISDAIFAATMEGEATGCIVCPHKGHKPCAKCEGCAYL
jgi:hypothetical protein